MSKLLAAAALAVLVLVTGLGAYLALGTRADRGREIRDLTSTILRLERDVLTLSEERRRVEDSLDRLRDVQKSIAADVVEVDAQLGKRLAKAVAAKTEALEVAPTGGKKMDVVAEIEEIVDWLAELSEKVQELEESPRITVLPPTGVGFKQHFESIQVDRELEEREASESIEQFDRPGRLNLSTVYSLGSDESQRSSLRRASSMLSTELAKLKRK